MNWKKTLLTYQKCDFTIQYYTKSLIIEAVKLALDNCIDETEFDLYMNGIVLFPEIIFYMYKEGGKKWG